MKFPLFAILVFSLLIAACSRSGSAVNNTEEPHSGLGEIMLAVQMRHAKLWFAGSNQNWDLAKYELDEIKESFEDVVTFHPTHKGVPQPLAKLVSTIIIPALDRVEKTIMAKNTKEFHSAFEGLVNSCNGCHEAATFGFNIIKKPETPPFSNQDFTPKTVEN